MVNGAVVAGLGAAKTRSVWQAEVSRAAVYRVLDGTYVSEPWPGWVALLVSVVGVMMVGMSAGGVVELWRVREWVRVPEGLVQVAPVARCPQCGAS